MKELLAQLRSENLLFRRLQPYDLRRIGSRKRIAAFLGVDLEGRYTLVFHVERKSRFGRKEAVVLRTLHHAIESAEGHAIRRCFAIIHAPLCSKAKKDLEEEGWHIVSL